MYGRSACGNAASLRHTHSALRCAQKWKVHIVHCRACAMQFFFFLVHWCIGAWPLDMAQTDFFFITNCIYIVQTADCCTLVSACVCVCVAHSNFTLKLHWICTFFFASQIKWKKMKASQRSRCQFATYYTIQARMGKHTRSNVHNMRLELILYEQLPCASHIYIYICGFLHYIVEWNANDF